MIKFAKTNEHGIIPTRGTPDSAGIDFYIPKDFEERWLDPGDRILIPSYIKSKFDSGHALIAFNKSGVSVKQGLDALACVVDADYQGVIHYSLVNTGNDPVKLSPNQKILQFILIKTPCHDIAEVPENELYEEETTRGEGGFGSTGETHEK